MKPRRTAVRIRRATSDDGLALHQVFEGMSPESRRRRYLAPIPRLSDSMQRTLLDVDDDHHVLFIAETGPRRRSQPIGLARYVVDEPRRAEIAYEVVDAWQGRGVGTRLLRQLVTTARAQGIEQLHGSLLTENAASLALLRRVLPQIEVHERPTELEFIAWLTPRDLEVADVLMDLGVA
jgi:RimJ/RimL family protein N-acetyltransferase